MYSYCKNLIHLKTYKCDNTSKKAAVPNRENSPYGEISGFQGEVGMQTGRKKLLEIININLLADFTEVMPLIFEPVEMSASY